MKNSSGAIYGMGVLGALVYYIQNATTFTDGAVGILKAVFWPGVLLHKVLSMLGM